MFCAQLFAAADRAHACPELSGHFSSPKGRSALVTEQRGGDLGRMLWTLRHASPFRRHPSPRFIGVLAPGKSQFPARLTTLRISLPLTEPCICSAPRALPRHANCSPHETVMFGVHLRQELMRDVVLFGRQVHEVRGIIASTHATRQDVMAFGVALEHAPARAS